MVIDTQGPQTSIHIKLELLIELKQKRPLECMPGNLTKKDIHFLPPHWF